VSTVDKYADLQATTQGHLLLSASSGRVGIGTVTPSANLAVSGNLHITVASDPIRFNGVAAGTTTTASYLALDSSNNLILTSSGGFRNIFVSASILNYTNPGDNRIITSVNSDSVNGEANLTFNGSVLSVTGQVTASVGVSASFMKASELTASTATVGEFFGTNILGTTITDGAATITAGNISGVGTITTTNVSASNVGGTLTTAAQTNVTSLGTLSGLAISGDLTVDTNVLKVNATTNKVSINKNTANKALEIFDNSAAQVRLLGFAGNGINTVDEYVDFQCTTDGFLILSSSGARVTTTSNFGIGVTAPLGKLHVSASNNTIVLEGLKSGTTTNDQFLALSGNVVILTSSVGGAGGAGGSIFSRRVVTANITASASDYFLAVSSSSNIEIRMPDANTLSSGKAFTVKDEAGRAGISGSIKISCQGAQTIDGFQSVLLESPHAAINLYTDGTSKYFIY
jgi:hypothetical protein